ncbi:MAG: DUF2871 domain-containing protein [Oscillospiraceae bacterium]|nr:DUF2871 domain-containing protein [Oscillospiraceae bacterium]
MKKCLNISLVYAIAGLVGGVFYREFTKMNGFEGVTALGKVHTHLLLLGMIVFLITALFCSRFKSLPERKTFKAFMVVYNIGVSMTAIMLAVRGVTEVLNLELTRAANAAISGIAGLSHIVLAVGIILLIVSLKGSAKSENAE